MWASIPWQRALRLSEVISAPYPGICKYCPDTNLLWVGPGNLASRIKKQLSAWKEKHTLQLHREPCHRTWSSVMIWSHLRKEIEYEKPEYTRVKCEHKSLRSPEDARSRKNFADKLLAWRNQEITTAPYKRTPTCIREQDTLLVDSLKVAYHVSER